MSSRMSDRLSEMSENISDSKCHIYTDLFVYTIVIGMYWHIYSVYNVICMHASPHTHIYI